MRRGSLFAMSLFLVVTLLVPNALIADEKTVNMESRILESFDPDSRTSDWYVRGSKFVADDTLRWKFAKSWPEAIFGRNKEDLDYQVLAISAAFKRTGYNYLEIIPVKRGADGELEPNPITIPGRAHKLDVWVWGSNYDYYLEVFLRDYKGVVHRLNMGDLNFVGWKNLYTEIPNYIPQAGGHVDVGGFLKTLELVKFVLWTKPHESVAGFNVYFDQVKILTDTFISRFDGDDLADPEYVESIWSSNGGN